MLVLHGASAKNQAEILENRSLNPTSISRSQLESQEEKKKKLKTTRKDMPYTHRDYGTFRVYIEFSMYTLNKIYI